MVPQPRGTPRDCEQTSSPLDDALRQTLTCDQGKEMALHKELGQGTESRMNFADPHSPWKRGINRNSNGLIRQCLWTDLSMHGQRQPDRMA